MPTHVDISKEFQHCRSMGQNLRKKLSLFCVKNNIKFLGTQGPFNLEEAIQSEQNTTPIILLQIHDALAGSKSYWKSINQQLSLIGKKLLVCTDSFVDMANFSNITFLTHPALVGLKHFHVDPDCYNDLSQNHSPGKLFNCFIHRADATRQSWFYFLYNAKLLDRGYISFLLYNHENKNQPEIELFDQLHSRHGMNQLPHFEDAYQNLRLQVPYRNFKENPVLWDKICDSKYSLVLDTYATNDNDASCYFSEKVARALMLPSLDLLFVEKNVPMHLESWGLVNKTSTLDMDHFSWQQRQTCLLEVLVQDSWEYNFTSLLETARHNHSVLKNYYYNTIDNFYTEVFDVATSKHN
jgi:hypothetical protein